MTHTELTIRIISAPLIAAFSFEKPDLQEKLADKTRAFVKQELLDMKAPQLKPDALDGAIFEIVSGFTLERIKKLEALLREAVLDGNLDEHPAERIENELG